MLIRGVDDLMYFGVLLSVIVRWAVSRFPYSGAGKPPMFGDYEAQRHWMEITVNLPVNEWYKNSTQNDLLYWGLDYPPLTAYHSMLCGYIAKWYNDDWISLNTSRGYESYHHKIFMRSTVLVSDLLFYIPVIIYWSIVQRPWNLRDKAIAAGLCLLYPGLILIDHGHFQISQFLKLSFVVLIVSGICWMPFLKSLEDILAVVERLFPFSRGLYEDKVANIWYMLSVIIKWKSIFSTPALVRLSAICTLLAVLPSSIHLLRNPSLHKFRLALVNSSLAFFLFSFQVHEKSILLPALPILLLLEDYPVPCLWFAYISTFSLVPLLAKDGLMIPFIALSALFLIGAIRAYEDLLFSFKNKSSTYASLLFFTSVLGSAILIISMFTIKQPAKYPHLHVLLNCSYSGFHFLGFLLYFNYLQFTEIPYAVYIKKIKYT